MVDERVLNKIKKCLALSGSPEPEEAAAALRQAQKLMKLHGVTDLDLRFAELGELDVKSKASVSRVKDWEVSLIHLVAKSFGCKMLWTRSSSYSHDVYGCYTLIGLEYQAKLAQYTAEVLQRKLMRGRTKFTQDLPEYLSRQEKTRQADGFCHGWVAAVAKTVHEFASPVEVTELIDARIRKYCGDRKAQIQIKGRQIGSFGFQAGLEAGSNESIQRPMTVEAPALQIN